MDGTPGSVRSVATLNSDATTNGGNGASGSINSAGASAVGGASGGGTGADGTSNRMPDASSDDPRNRPKEAACLVCRRSKVKCEKDPLQTRCKRCILAGSDCVRPAFHVGRQKGIKNKRKGLDKALYQIEQALKRARSGEQTVEDDKALVDLQSLLEATSSKRSPGSRGSSGGGHRVRRRRLDGVSAGGGGGLAANELSESSSDGEDDDGLRDSVSPVPRTHISPQLVPSAGAGPRGGVSSTAALRNGRRTSTIAGPRVTDVIENNNNLAIDDAENPLQLLARASDLQLSPKLANGRVGGPTSKTTTGVAATAGGIGPGGGKIPARTAGSAVVASREALDDMVEVQNFFTSIRVTLDVGEDIDPISLGLVTDDEADALFSFFHKNLAHTRWGMDPHMYTVPFTRSRSAFLFTSILAASALFIPTAGALSRRLSAHVKALAHRVLAQRNRSVEIVLAFLVNVPWMFPGKHSTDDETTWYVSVATSIAIDLSLHKVLVPAEAFGGAPPRGLARGDCIDPATALALDGFAEVDPASELGTRLLRRRERCWLALFVLERGMCLARGRSYTVPITHLIRQCDDWHRSPVADGQDGHLVSMAVLRRDLDGLFSAVRSLCDGSRTRSTDGSLIAQSIQSAIEKFFEQWLTEWGISIGIGPQRRLPPYVEILVTHTRLSTYSGVVNHPTAPPEVRHFFRTAGLSSALSVMRAAIQGEAQLQSMPNNTVIMISFAASFALRLSAQVMPTTGNSNLAPSIRSLIEEAAGVLERIGCTTKHRNGMSALHGRYLRYIVRKVAIAAETASGRASVEPPSHRPSSAAAAAAGPGVGGPQGGMLAPPPTHGRSAVGYGVGDPMVGAAAAAQQQQQQQQHPHQHQHQQAQAAFVGGGPMWSEQRPIQFSSMSDDQIVEALGAAGNEFDLHFQTMPWEEAVGFDLMNWSLIPDFNNY